LARTEFLSAFKWLFKSALLSAASFSYGIDYYLIGGQDNGPTTPYAALVDSNAVATEVTGLPPTGNILSVSINGSGYGILGGVDNTSTPYAALVDQSGIAAPIALGTMGTGNVRAVAINNSRAALAGGDHAGGFMAFLTQVSPSGAATTVSTSAVTRIYDVALNESGQGIWGSTWFAGMVSPLGISTTITGLPTGGSTEFRTVAINSSGAGIVGGHDTAFNVYAALVSPAGVATTLTGDLPAVGGAVFSVAINDAGAAIISGILVVGDSRYLAVVSPSGVATRILMGDIPTIGGSYNAVDINEAGNALIGGDNTASTYQSRLASGSVLPVALTGMVPSGSGSIVSASLNDEGNGIIGGQDTGSTTAYAGLVSPSGAVTKVTGALPVGTGIIRSVSVGNAPSPSPSLLNALTPATIGPAFGAPALNSLLAASLAFGEHVDSFHKFNHVKKGENPSLSLVSQSDISMSGVQQRRYRSPVKTPAGASDSSNPADSHASIEEPQDIHYPGLSKSTPYAVWIAPFYDTTFQQAQYAFPASTIQTGGAMAGFDYWQSDALVLGGGGAYAYSYIGVNDSLGHASVNEGMLTLYGSYKGDYFFLNLGCWGGYYGLKSERHTLGFITSTGKTHGWLASPHIELCGSDYSKQSDWIFIEGFVMADWVNNWQSGYTETGRAGFNLIVPNLYNSLLRSEAGLTFYQTFPYTWGRLLLREQTSYINLAPFDFNPATTAFIGSASTFTVATGTDHI